MTEQAWQQLRAEAAERAVAHLTDLANTQAAMLAERDAEVVRVRVALQEILDEAGECPDYGYGRCAHDIRNRLPCCIAEARAALAAAPDGQEGGG